MAEPSKHSATSIRAWIIGGYAVIVAVLAILWGYSLFSPIDAAEIEQQYQSLLTAAKSESVALSSSDLSPQEIVNKVAESGKLRSTVIDKDGNVLADSEDDYTAMGNHLTRPEVQTALTGEVGYDRRTSDTDGIEYLYVAIPSEYGGRDVVLRVSMAVSEVNMLAQNFRNTGMILLVISIVFAIITAWVAFQKSAKPVSQLAQVRSDFVANASHELKTPVAGIRLLAESIDQASRDGDTEMIPIFADRLKKESERLQNLVTSLLDLSRLENADRTRRTRQTCDLACIVGTSYDAHVLQAQNKGLIYRYNDAIACNDSCRVKLSPTDASLLVDNLIENAITYTDEGSVLVSLKNNADNVVLTIEDTGIGIPTADQERVFERFYRVDTARSREMGGTGLGLSLVRHAVKSVGGTISLESELGKGTTITVTLPK